MGTIAARISDELHRSFKAWCARRGRTMAEVVHRLVDDWVKEQERLDQTLAALQTASQALKEELNDVKRGDDG